MTDIHNHLLFGIDDGSKSIEDSVDVLRDMAEFGYKSVILTPHYIKDSNYNSKASHNFKLLKELRSALKENNIDINVYLGNEIYIDDDIYELLKSGDVYSLNGTSYVLIELPMNGEYSNYIEIFKDLIRKGCHVVLAHPERYLSFQKDYDKIIELKKMGIYFQSNIDSLIGRYGEDAEVIIKKLLKDKMISFLATDIHHKKHDYNVWNEARNLALKYISEHEYDILVNINPGKLIS
jgi:protein-tyrosine phosphatase